MNIPIYDFGNDPEDITQAFEQEELTGVCYEMDFEEDSFIINIGRNFYDRKRKDN